MIRCIWWSSDEKMTETGRAVEASRAADWHSPGPAEGCSQQGGGELALTSGASAQCRFSA